MNTTTRTLIAIPLAAAALSAGATPVMAESIDYVSDNIAQPDPQPEPEPGPQLPGDKVGPAGDPGPQDGPDDKDGPNNDPGPDGPDDKDGPNNDPGPDGPDDLDSVDHDDDDDGDNDDDGGNDVKRPSRVDAGGTEDGLSFAWLLASGAMVTAAGGFTARRAALKRR